MSQRERLAPAVLAALLAGACSVATPSPAARVSPDPTRHVLSNGVRVIVQEFAESQVVAAELWVAAGSRDEPVPGSGLAHYLEHMLFRGTATRPAGMVRRQVEAAGGRMNAGTSVDYTYYRLVLPAGGLARSVDLLADIGVNATLEPGAFGLERQVVLEERRRSRDDPRRDLLGRLQAMLFAHHPYGPPVVGTPEAIRAVDREAVLGFYRRHYVPEAFTLVVVGPVGARETVEAAERSFGRIPRSGFRRLAPPTPRPPERVERQETPRAGTHAYLGLAWLGPRLDHADTPAVDLAVALLGQLRSSRLVESLQDRLGVAHWVRAGYSALEGGGMITVIAQVEPGRVEQAEAEVVRQVRRLGEEGLSRAELRRARTAAEARHAFAAETAEGRAHAYGRAETIWRLSDELAYVDRLRSLTTEQVRLAARRYLDPTRYDRVALVPAR